MNAYSEVYFSELKKSFTVYGCAIAVGLGAFLLHAATGIEIITVSPAKLEAVPVITGPAPVPPSRAIPPEVTGAPVANAEQPPERARRVRGPTSGSARPFDKAEKPSALANETPMRGAFAGFDGSWSGSGTVVLADGTTEQIRCKADYKVTATGLGLKQNLHCASNSYRFDLSSNITSQGDRISGNWGEDSRDLFGNLQGTAGRGQIDVFVEAAGFAANLNLRTSGAKQVVQIDPKGETSGGIRGVNVTMNRTGGS